MIRRIFASLGRSFKVRLVLPMELNRPHMARMAAILAIGRYLRGPGTESSGRAQEMTQKALSQKNALLDGSTTRKDVRLAETSARTRLPLSPMTTNSSFSQAFFSAKRGGIAHRARDFISATDCKTSAKRSPIAGQS